MTGTELIEYVRVLTADIAKPYLWSDDNILRFLQEAEKQFCRRTHVIRKDRTLDLVAGTTTYVLPDSVLKVYGASITGTQLSYLLGDAIHIHYTTATGEPRSFVTGMDNRRMTFYPSPDGAYTVDMFCATYPDDPVALATESEIPEEYQYLLCDFAAYKCLITNDVDGTNVGTGQKFEQRWNEGILEAKRAHFWYRTPDRVAMPQWTGGK